MTCHITSSMYKTCPSMHVNEITGVAMILCNYRLWTKKRIIGHAKLTDFSYFPWNCRDSRSWIEWSRVISCYSARDKVTTRTRRIRGRHSCVKRNLIELRLTATVSTPTQNMGYLLDVNNGRTALSPNTFVCQTFNWKDSWSLTYMRQLEKERGSCFSLWTVGPARDYLPGI